MESAVESYKNGNYDQALQLCTKSPDLLIECKTLLKLNQMKGAIPFGSCLSKPNTDHLRSVVAKASGLTGQDKELVQQILNYYQDKDVMTGPADESKFYFGLWKFETQEYEEALAILSPLGDLENKDDQKHKLLLIAECHIQLGEWKKATKILEHIGVDSYGYALLSECYFKMGQGQQGEQWLKESLKVNQNCFYAQLNQIRQNQNVDEEIKLIEKFSDPANSRLTRQLIHAYVMKASTKATRCMGEYACRPRGELVKKCLEMIEKAPKCNATDFLKAQVLYYNYSDTEATKEFEKCIKNNFKPIESRFYQTMIKKDQINYKECTVEFMQLSQQTKGTMKDDCHFWRVVIFMELNELEQALKELEFIQPNAQNYTLISRLYNLKGDKAQADTWIKEALKMNSNCFYAKVEKGIQDVKFDCINLLDQLIKDDPFNICAKQGLIKQLIMHSENSIKYAWGEYSCKPNGAEIIKAADLLKQVKTVRESIQLDFYDAILHYYTDNLKESESLFMKCINANYQFWTCKYYLSLIKKDQMKYEECLNLSLAVANHEDQFKQACHANRAWIFIQQSLPDKAIKELENNTHGCQYYVLLGQSYIMKGNSAQANTWFNESLKINPNCLYAKINKAILEQKQEDILKLLEGAQKTDPENYVITWHRGKVLFRMNKFELALQLFDKCIQQKHLIAYASKAKLLRSLGKEQEALKVLDMGLQADDQLPPLLVVKASILFDQKKYEESIQICNQVQDQKNVHVLRQKALAFRALNKKDEAFKLYNEILAIDRFNIQAFVGKAQIQQESEEIYEILQQLSDIVLHKKLYKATMNPIVVQNCLDLLKLNSDFTTKGGVIEKVIAHSKQMGKQQQEYEALKQQKEQLCTEKIDCIMNPILQVKKEATEDILKKLTILHKQITDVQEKQQTQIYEQLLTNPTSQLPSNEEEKVWQQYTKEIAEKTVKDWNDNNMANDKNKHNYATVFYNLMFNHCKSYAVIQNEQISEGQQYFKTLQLGNSFVIIDDIIDNTFTMIKMIKYINRQKALLKVIKVNQLTTKCENNLQLIIALCAQTCADQIDFTKEVQSVQSHSFKYQQKFLLQEIEEFASKSQIQELQMVSGKYAIRDVVIAIGYLQHNYISIIRKSQQVPFHQFFIGLADKHVELATESHPVNQQISVFNGTYTMKDYKPNSKRDRAQGDEGCCIVM